MDISRLKSMIKNKIKFDHATLIKYLIMGVFIISYPALSEPTNSDSNNVNLNVTEINITTVSEKTGIETGTNSYARGENAVSTGKNSIAIGRNAVATGGNETLETIKAKIAENEAKLKEITLKKEEITRLTKELEDLKLKERETIEAGIRVKEILKSKENLKLKWQSATQDYNNYVEESKQKIADYNTKIDDLNSRLSALSTIPNLDLNSEQGLTEAARQLKAKAEANTTLNLSEEFYKEYAKNYYKALGNLRESEIIISKADNTGFGTFSNNTNNQDIVKYAYNLSYHSINDRVGIFINQYSDNANKNSISFETNYNSNDRIILSKNGKYEKELYYYDINYDIITKEKYEEFLNYEDEFKETVRTHMENSNDRFLTSEIREQLYKVFTLKYEHYKKRAEICYYQGEYERTKNTTWLDKKKVAIKELDPILLDLNKANSNAIDLKTAEINKFKKENITDIKEKNKITVDTLTSELEVALGINKSEIQNIENTKTQLKKLSDDYYNQYNNLNPTEKDLILSREYERVSELLKNKSTNLATQVARLKELQDGLTLHDLTNIGENAIAIGNETISSGTNAIAFGKGNIATKENAVAIGADNLVNSINGIGLGKGNVLSGEKTIAIGTDNVVKGTGSGVFGDPNYVYGDNNYVVGNNNKVGVDGTPKNNVFILGSNVDASNVSNAIVLGNNSKAVENALSIGSTGNERKIVNVAKGTENTDAINLSQLKELQKATGLTDDEITKINNNNANKPKTIIERINELKNNGALIYVNKDDKNKEPLVKGEDNKYYPNNSVIGKDGKHYPNGTILNKDKTPQDTNVQPLEGISPEKVVIVLKNPDGSTNKVTQLGNIATGIKDTDAVNVKQLKDAISSITLTNSQENNDLYEDKVSESGEKTRVLKGITFASNNGNVKKTLGDTLDIIGGKGISNVVDGDFSDLNTSTKVDNGKLNILFNDRPTFKEVTVQGDKTSTQITKDGIVINGDTTNITYGKDGITIKDKNGNDGKLFVNNKEVLTEDRLKDMNRIAVGAATSYMAMSNIPQVSANKKMSLGAGVGYYDNSFALALGLSGQNNSKNFIYKASLSINDQMKFGVGVGLNYSFGDIPEIEKVEKSEKTEKIAEKVIENTINTIDKETITEYIENSTVLNDLKNTINELKSKLDEQAKINNELREKLTEKIENTSTESIESTEININNICELNRCVITGFNTNSYKLSESGKEKIKEIVKLLNEKVEYAVIDIVGHADKSGNFEYNLNLGNMRAKTVVELLNSYGLKKEIVLRNITSSSNLSKISNTQKENRRVELHFDTIKYK